MQLVTKRAITILSGWLEAAKIPFTVQGSTIYIKGKKKKTTVVIADGNPCNSKELLPSTIVDSLDISMPIFWLITEKAGYGRPVVVKRKAVSESYRYNDNPEFVAMRHHEFRRTANPPIEMFLDIEYKKIIQWTSNRFYSSNRSLCAKNGYDVEDVSQFCWIFATNFYGLWRHPDNKEEEKLGYNNKKLLIGYIQQRLNQDLKNMLKRKVRSIYLDEEGASVGQNVEFLPQYNSGSENGAPHLVAVSPVQEEEMSHEELIDVLLLKSSKGNSMAKRALVLHRSDCLDCQKAGANNGR